MESVRQEQDENSGSEEYSESEEEEDTADEGSAMQDATDDTLVLVSDDSPPIQHLHSTTESATESAPVEDPLAEQFEALHLENHDISDLSDDRLSRSPPQSRRPYPHSHNGEQDSADEVVGNDKEISKDDVVKNRVASDITKKRAQQQRKYHSKRSTRSAGRTHGSKAKQDKTVRLSEHAGFWG